MPFFLLYCLVTGKHLESLKERFGFFILDRPWQHRKRIWFHAASVGEVQVAKALIDECTHLRLQADFIVTTVTLQGQLVARSQLGSLAVCLYAPLDLPWIIRSFLNKIQPTAYVCLETELWPNVLKNLHDHNVKTLLLNGRMSDKSFNNYKKLYGFFHQVVGYLDMISVINDSDKSRYAAFGYPEEKIEINGNAKYALRDNHTFSSGSVHNEESIGNRYRKLLNINNGEPVLVAGSTHTGEEDLLARMYDELATRIPGLVLIIAPRHLERIGQLLKKLDELDVTYQTFSGVKESHKRSSSIIILDVMGELRNIYTLATYVFCGGSLVEKGGHNIMEPAIAGKAPIYGPHMTDFPDAVALLENKGAGFMVKSSNELINLLFSFAQNPKQLEDANEKARAIAYAQTTAAHNQIQILKNILTH